jgi:hypothetical protein
MPIYEVEVDGQVYEGDAPTAEAAAAAAKKASPRPWVARPLTRTAALVPTPSRLTAGRCRRSLGPWPQARRRWSRPPTRPWLARKRRRAPPLAPSPGSHRGDGRGGSLRGPGSSRRAPGRETAAFYAAANAALEKLGLSGETRAILRGTLFARGRQPTGPLP